MLFQLTSAHVAGTRENASHSDSVSCFPNRSAALCGAHPPRKRSFILHGHNRAPSAPSFLEGVIDVRGTLIPVIDLRKRLGFSQPQNNLETRIMVLSSGKRRVGAIVDSVLQVVSIPVEKIQEPPDTTRIHGVNYILAFAKSAGEIYIILDLDHLLTSSEVLSLEQDSDQSGTEAIRKD